MTLPGRGGGAPLMAEAGAGLGAGLEAAGGPAGVFDLGGKLLGVLAR